MTLYPKRFLRRCFLYFQRAVSCIKFAKNTLPETNIAHENPIFLGKYHQNGGFSMAMLVYRRVIFFGGKWKSRIRTNNLTQFIKSWWIVMSFTLLGRGSRSDTFTNSGRNIPKSQYGPWVRFRSLMLTGFQLGFANTTSLPNTWSGGVWTPKHLLRLGL